MSCQILLLLTLSLLLFSSQSNARQIPRKIILTQNDAASSSPCPLNFTSVSNLIHKTNVNRSNDVAQNCQYITQILRLILSDYLHSTGFFHPPLDSAESCWDSFDSLVDSVIPGFKTRPSCNLRTSWISESCMNVSTRSEFERLVPRPALNDAVLRCNRSLGSSSLCASCLTSLATLQESFVNDPSPACAVGGISDWANLPLIFAGAFISPTGLDTTKCLFSLDFTATNGGDTRNRNRKVVISVSMVMGLVGIGSILGGYLVFPRLKKRREKYLKKKRCTTTYVRSGSESMRSRSGSESMRSAHLMKLTLDEIKQATTNFHRDNLIGRGGYGNVFKGTFPDGSEVAIKRFKNCSAGGESRFTHEVEIIASIRHVNLVELKGYCAATTDFEGHQRIIVCDLMRNGSLHDHLFESGNHSKLSWPIRQKIALGMARGLAYLHYGAQPAVIHRDIKASNIMLDENFEAKVGDFGLAKFYPEGFSHLSTQVAGTMGYVAPEYALYGQLSERSDVYSFGVVLLELLSGKKAILSSNEDTQVLLTDWAWSLVKEGCALSVVEKEIPEHGSDQVIEKYVTVAVLCSHPQLYARPTMDQVVKILESDLPLPLILETKAPNFDEVGDIERVTSAS